MSTPYLYASQTKLVLQCKKDLEGDEGLRLFAYPDVMSKLYKQFPHLPWGFRSAREIAPPGINWDSGKPWTYGYGETEGVGPDSVITQIQADRKVESRVLQVENQLLNALPWFADASFETRTVLINMAYNMGIMGLLKFRNSLGMLKAKRYEAAAQNLKLSLWYTQVGNRARKLVQRITTQTIAPQDKAPECIC